MIRQTWINNGPRASLAVVHLMFFFRDRVAARRTVLKILSSCSRKIHGWTAAHLTICVGRDGGNGCGCGHGGEHCCLPP